MEKMNLSTHPTKTQGRPEEFERATRLRVNMISESEFTVQGHGVHTAYVENLHALSLRPEIDIEKNTDRPADIVHIQTVGPYSLKRLLKKGPKKVVSAHLTPDSFVGSFIGAKYWYPLAKMYLRWFYNRADSVLAVSNEVADVLKSMGVKKKIYVVPNTIDTAQFAHTPEQKKTAREKFGIKDSDFVVLCTGQVQPRKRIDIFIKCAEALPEIKFFWVGGVPFKQFAAEHKKMDDLMKHHVSNVYFTGVIEHEDVIAHYWAADLFFLPSEQETFGIVIVEGAAAGLPVLLRDIEQYKITFNGWYASGDDNTFASLIKKFATDSNFYEEWKTKSANIPRAYDSKAGAQRLVDIYKQTLLK